MKLPARHCVVLDFDGTCIPREVVALIPVVDRKALPETAREDLERIWATYGTRALDGSISQIEAFAWIVQTVELYARHRVTLAETYRALDGIRLKRGFKRFLADMHRRSVPVAIISFGIKQFIWYVLEKENVAHLVSDIFATDLVTWDISLDANPITELDMKSVVVPHLKGDFSKRFASRYGVPDDGIIAVGDSPGDALLGSLKENRICLIEKASELRKQNLVRNFGEILVTKSFVPAHKAVLRCIKRHKPR